MAAAALPACLSVCPSLCWLHRLWIMSLHRNTKPLQRRLVVWENKCLSRFSWTGASWFVDTHYRGVWEKAEFSCSKMEIRWWEFQKQEVPGTSVVVQGTGDWPTSVTSLFTGGKPPSVLRETFGGDIIRRILVTFPSLFGLLLQVLQQKGSVWHRAGTLRFSLH